jgi:thiol-disulfide isomerase/thioredoxin
LIRRLAGPFCGLSLLALVAQVNLAAALAASDPPLDGWMQNFTVYDTPRPAPDAPLQDGDGNPVRLADHRGKVLLVNFWATWCAPCVRELPSLDRLNAKHAGPDFEVLAVSADFGGAHQVRPFYAEHGIRSLALILDKGGALRRAAGVRALPTTLLIDRAGNELGRLQGVAEWDTPEVEALLDWAARQSAGPS